MASCLDIPRFWFAERGHWVFLGNLTSYYRRGFPFAEALLGRARSSAGAWEREIQTLDWLSPMPPRSFPTKPRLEGLGRACMTTSQTYMAASWWLSQNRSKMPKKTVKKKAKVKEKRSEHGATPVQLVCVSKSTMVEQMASETLSPTGSQSGTSSLINLTASIVVMCRGNFPMTI